MKDFIHRGYISETDRPEHTCCEKNDAEPDPEARTMF